MKTEEYYNIYIHEEKHFYYQATREIICDLIKRNAQKNKKLSILDAGCGTGLTGIMLKQFGDVIGIDISPDAVKLSKKRGLKTVIGSTEQIPLKDNEFDVVVSIDVLYHQWVKNEHNAFQELYRVLKPGGVLILRVPAIPWLKKPHDNWVMTKRRFTLSQIQKELSIIGLRIIIIRYIQCILIPFALLQFMSCLIPTKISSHSDVKAIPLWINALLKQVLLIDYKLSLFFPYPIGLGLICIATKRKLT